MVRLIFTFAEQSKVVHSFYCFVHTLSANVYILLKGVPFWPKLHV